MSAVDDFLAFRGQVTTISQQEEAAKALQRVNPTLYAGATGPGSVAFETAGRYLSMTEANIRTGLSVGAYAVPNQQWAVPPLPHPDASNLSLGPNLGGQDAVVDTPMSPSSGSGSGASGAGGLLLLGVVGVLVFAALRRK